MVFRDLGFEALRSLLGWEPMIRTTVYCSVYWVPLCYGNYQIFTDANPQIQDI